MPLEKEYLASLGLEIAKKKYYNAAKVESVIEDLTGRSDALEQENAALERENTALRERVSALATGREEIGDAILSAKTIARQLIAEAQEEADALLAAAREEADRILSEAREKSGALLKDGESREQKTIRAAKESYLQLRESCLDAVRMLDGEWQRFLCSFAEDAPVPDRLPEEFSDKLGELAACLSEIEEDAEAEQ